MPTHGVGTSEGERGSPYFRGFRHGRFLAAECVLVGERALARESDWCVQRNLTNS